MTRNTIQEFGRRWYPFANGILKLILVGAVAFGVNWMAYEQHRANALRTNYPYATMSIG